MSGTEEQVLVTVPAKLSSTQAATLKDLLTEKRGRPICLEFMPVTQLGTQSIQVLLAAKAAWDADSLSFEIQNMSSDIRETLQVCGLEPSRIGAKEVQNDG